MTFQNISDCIYFVSGFIGSQNNAFVPAFEGYIKVMSTPIAIDTYTNVSPSAPQDNEEEETEFEVADCFLYLPHL